MSTIAGPIAAGPTTASPTTAGQTTASPTTTGPTTASPTTAGQTTASPNTAGQTTASPTTAGPTTAGQCEKVEIMSSPSLLPSKDISIRNMPAGKSVEQLRPGNGQAPYESQENVMVAIDLPSAELKSFQIPNTDSNADKIVVYVTPKGKTTSEPLNMGLVSKL